MVQYWTFVYTHFHSSIKKKKTLFLTFASNWTDYKFRPIIHLVFMIKPKHKYILVKFSMDRYLLYHQLRKCKTRKEHTKLKGTNKNIWCCAAALLLMCTKIVGIRFMYYSFFTDVILRLYWHNIGYYTQIGLKMINRNDLL